VLLVDDDESIIKSLTKALERSGFEVISSDRMTLALGLFESRHVDVVITDFHIQDGSGRQLLHKIRRQNLTIPIYLMTGTPYVDESALLVYGFSKVFLKPFLPQEIILELKKIEGLEP
jgi:DNA-binding response OmpR family regulator